LVAVRLGIIAGEGEIREPRSIDGKNAQRSRRWLLRLRPRSNGPLAELYRTTPSRRYQLEKFLEKDRLSNDEVQNEQNRQQIRHSTVLSMSARNEFNDRVGHKAKCQALGD